MTTQTDPRERPEIRTTDDTMTAAVNEMTVAIREFKTLLEAERRGKDRAIQWLSIGLATLGTLAAILGVAIAVTN